MSEEQYEFDGHTYLITKLPLGASKEVLLRLTKIGLFAAGEEGFNMGSITSKLRPEDLDFFESKVLGTHCQYLNESGNWVPLGKALVSTHFDGRLGQYFHMIAKCLLVNFSDFLGGLHIDGLVEVADPE
ncbi:MAG: hypothetical protein OEU26_00130 [Candidatus Tectomicrobia bacterium]|nr:hypothetical protein [Candidatus Tectomicrobia bacterium]